MSDPALSQFSAQVEQQRIDTLYRRLPASVISVLVGVVLVFVFLVQRMPGEQLKAWAAFMLTTVAVRGWVWYLYTSGERTGSLRRWEWSFALAAMLSGIGWGLLSIGLFPADMRLQAFVITMALIISFAATVYVSVSYLAFWLSTLPVIVPASYRYAEVSTLPIYAAPIASLCTLIVLLIVQRTLHGFAMESIRRQVRAEALLAEQQAIFQASPLGILVIDGARVAKCNTRLGELLHRNLADTERLDHAALFASPEEAGKFDREMVGALRPGRSVNGIYRLRRADGSEFWAEINGRPLGEAFPRRSVWTVADIGLRGSNGRSHSEGAASPAPSFNAAE